MKDIELKTMKKTRVWLDDCKIPPDKTWLWVKDYDSFVAVLDNILFSEISFDHDLGESSEKTGYDCAKIIEQLAYEGKINPLKWNIHSANPAEKRNIKLAMEQAETYWNDKIELCFICEKRLRSTEETSNNLCHFCDLAKN